MANGIGYGKIILFGEHFVVHGCPAIALGIGNKAIVEIQKAEKLSYTSEVKGTLPKLTTAAIQNIMDAMQIKDAFHVHLKGDLPTIGGLGSSAAFCVALVRALNEEYQLNLTDEIINSHAYEGEKAFHGNPSGIDNTMATYGGAIKFIRDKGFESIKLHSPLYLVVASTGIPSPTAKMVAKVAAFKEKNTKVFDHLLDSAEKIVSEGVAALAAGNIQKIGSLMNANQDLLSAIGVSSERNDLINRVATEAGALGNKLTGGGGGGSCIALASDENHAQQILDKLKEKRFKGFVTALRQSS